MRRFLLAAIALFVCAFGANIVHAQSSTSGPFTTSTPISSTATDYTGSLTFPKFNSSLGSLISMTITIQTDLSATVTITNTASTSEMGYCYPGIDVGFTDPSGYLPTPFDMYYTPTAGSLVAVALTKPYTFTLAGNSSVTSPTLTSTNYSTTSFDAFNYQSLLREFTGSSGSTITLSLATYTGFDAQLQGSGSASTSASLAITGTITYTYQ